MQCFDHVADRVAGRGVINREPRPVRLRLASKVRGVGILLVGDLCGSIVVVIAVSLAIVLLARSDPLGVSKSSAARKKIVRIFLS